MIRIKDLILGPNGLLKPEIQAAQFERIYYGALSHALGIDADLGYSQTLDARIKAYLVHGTIVNSSTFVFRGMVVYVMDGDLIALSWKNCGNCRRIAFFQDSMVYLLRALLLDAAYPQKEPLKLVSLNDPFDPRP